MTMTIDSLPYQTAEERFETIKEICDSGLLSDTEKIAQIQNCVNIAPYSDDAIRNSITTSAWEGIERYATRQIVQVNNDKNQVDLCIFNCGENPHNLIQWCNSCGYECQFIMHHKKYHADHYLISWKDTSWEDSVF